MKIPYKKFKAEIPVMQDDAYDTDAYFFWEHGKETSILSYFQQELRKMEAYAILEEIRRFELKSITNGIVAGTSFKAVVDKIKDHFTTHNKNSVLLSTINEQTICSLSGNTANINDSEMLSLKAFELATQIKANLRNAQKDPDKFLQKANSGKGQLFNPVVLSNFLKTETKTARQISDEYILQKNHFRNGYLKEGKYTLGWEYTTEFVDRKIAHFEEEVKKNVEFCDRYFADAGSKVKITRNTNTKKIFEKIADDFKQLSDLRNLKSAIVQFREHGADFKSEELSLNKEMLDSFIKRYKVEILPEVKAYRTKINLAAGLKAPKIKDVSAPDIFLPVIPIIETINNITEHFSHHGLPNIRIYDSGQKGFTSMSRKVRQDLYDGSAYNISDGIRNTPSFDNEDGFKFIANALEKYLNSKGIIYTYHEHVVASGYLSRKMLIPVTLDKAIEMPNSGGKVNISATRVAEVKFARNTDLALKKETDLFYHAFRQLCPTDPDNKGYFLQIEEKEGFSHSEVLNSRLFAKQVIESLYTGLLAHPSLMAKVDQLNKTDNFNFPLHKDPEVIDKILESQESFMHFAKKILNAEKLLNCQNLNVASMEDKKVFYRCAIRNNLQPSDFFSDNSLLELKDAFNQDRQGSRKLESASRY